MKNYTYVGTSVASSQQASVEGKMLSELNKCWNSDGVLDQNGRRLQIMFGAIASSPWDVTILHGSTDTEEVFEVEMLVPSSGLYGVPEYTVDMMNDLFDFPSNRRPKTYFPRAAKISVKYLLKDVPDQPGYSDLVLVAEIRLPREKADWRTINEIVIFDLRNKFEAGLSFLEGLVDQDAELSEEEDTYGLGTLGVSGAIH